MAALSFREFGLEQGIEAMSECKTKNQRGTNQNKTKSLPQPRKTPESK